MAKEYSRRNFLKKSGLAVAGLAASVYGLSGCAITYTGIPTEFKNSFDFGKKEIIKFEVHRNPGVSDNRIDQIVAAMNEEYTQFNIEAKVQRVKPFERKGFATFEVAASESIKGIKIEDDCDRNLYLLDRNVFDHVWGILGLPEAMGMVDMVTSTNLFLVANYEASVGQILSGGPNRWAKHEASHLLGAPHGTTKKEEYERIELLKDIKRVREEEAPGENFFPGYNQNLGQVLYKREQVNDLLRKLGTYLVDNVENYKKAEIALKNY